MSKLNYHKLHKLLKNNTLIANSITETLLMLKNIEIFLQNQLPPQLQQHLRPLNISGNKLILMVDSPAWKSRIRFLLPDLEKKLQRYTNGNITAVVLKVIPVTDRDVGKTTARKIVRTPMSSTSRSIINSFADDLDDSRLKASLLRLGHRKYTRDLK